MQSTCVCVLRTKVSHLYERNNTFIILLNHQPAWRRFQEPYDYTAWKGVRSDIFISYINPIYPRTLLEKLLLFAFEVPTSLMQWFYGSTLGCTTIMQPWRLKATTWIGLVRHMALDQLYHSPISFSYCLCASWNMLKLMHNILLGFVVQRSWKICFTYQISLEVERLIFVDTFCRHSRAGGCSLWIWNRGGVSRWWFQIFFIFTPIWGRFPFWLTFFRWVETTN